MQRLVYAPRVQAWVKTDTGIVDVSDFITAGNVTRKINQVSSATLTCRNPKGPDGRMLFTEAVQQDGTLGPLLHPQDPIIITLTRLRDRPIQVFTGYCDVTPYLELFPGTVTISASCTLKRLQYQWWDPGLPFVRTFLANYGWFPNEQAGGISAPKAETEKLQDVNSFTDGSIANLLLAVLTNVAEWDESTIYIEPLPKAVGPLVVKLFQEFQTGQQENHEIQQAYEGLLTSLIGKDGGGGGGPGGASGSGGPVKGHYDKASLRKLAESVGISKSNSNLAAAIALAESAGNPKAVNVNTNGTRDRGLWQINTIHSQYSDACCFNPNCNAKAMYAISSGGSNWQPWSTYNNGSYRQFL